VGVQLSMCCWAGNCPAESYMRLLISKSFAPISRDMMRISTSFCSSVVGSAFCALLGSTAFVGNSLSLI
jgi:hypothetical protein